MFRKLIKYLLLAVPTVALAGLVFSQTITSITGDWEFVSDGVHYNAIYRRGFLGLGILFPLHTVDIVGDLRAIKTETVAVGDGTRYFEHTVNSSQDPAAAAEVSSLYGAYNWSAGTNGVFIANGVEGVVRSRVNDEAGTFRGGLFRTYIDTDTDPNASMRTSIGAEISARAAYLGGTAATAEPGTAFVGARIWMAPYFAIGSLGNINNFWGLWIYGEHATQRNADSAIKISTAGGGFTDDLILQSGSRIYDSPQGIHFRGNIAEINGATPYIWPGANAAGQLTNDGAGNLSWTPGGNVTGSGSDTFVAFWTTPTNIVGSKNLVWITATKRLGIGTYSPLFNIDLAGNMRGIFLEGNPAVDGTRYFQYTVDSNGDPAPSAEVTALYGAYNWYAGTNGVFTVNGVEGVSRSWANDEAGTFRGGYFRTYIDTDTDPNSSMRTAIGAEMSARAAHSGGVDAVAEAGTAFVGARIWMAPYFTAGSLANINNFWGLWIYGEHASQRNADAAIKISTAGGGFTDDIILQRGTTITDIAAGLKLNPSTGQVLFPDLLSISYASSPTTGIYFTGAGTKEIVTIINNDPYFEVFGYHVVCVNSTLGFSTAIGSPGDVVLQRDAPNILAQKNENADQAQRWYGANGSYFQVAAQSELLTILAAAFTDTAMSIPANAIVKGVAVYVVTTIPAPATTFSVTGATSGTIFNTAAVGVGAGSSDVGTQNTPYKNGAAQLIRITPDAIPGAATGQVRIVLFYEIPSPPTS